MYIFRAGRQGSKQWPCWMSREVSDCTILFQSVKTLFRKKKKKQLLWCTWLNIKKLNHPNVYQEKFLVIRCSLPSHVPVYTDGSKSDGHESAAVVIGPKCFGKSIPGQSSFFTAKAYALLLALEQIIKEQQRHFLICTDSRSCL